MPHVTVVDGSKGRPCTRWAASRSCSSATRDPTRSIRETGERYDDVICLWVESEVDKQALVGDPATPFFTTAHFDGYPAVLVRAGRLGEISRQELAEVVQDAWLARASRRRATDWLTTQQTG